MHIKTKILVISTLMLLFSAVMLKAADMITAKNLTSAKDGESFMLEGSLEFDSESGNYIFKDATGTVAAYIDDHVITGFKQSEFLKQKVRITAEYESDAHFDIIAIADKADSNNKNTIATIKKDGKNRGTYMLNGSINSITKDYKTNRPYYIITDRDNKTIETKFDGAYEGDSRPLNKLLLITVEYEHEVHVNVNKIELIK